ncbi:zinc-ribbon domain-containing protein [Roseomonas sp. USHLN139]|uniref:zinc-ribbon domain-containing protein n=1 Tax=Roseomonas sp. USHLN139 TaxID=3081298 RepID=UPI003B013665
MRIECPDCAAAYDVPEALVAPGREVRCVRCAHAWVPRPALLPALAEEAAAEPVEALPLRSEAPRLPPARAEEQLPAVIPPPPRASRAPVVVAWIASLLLVAGGCVALWHYRLAIVAAWPPSARLFGWIAGVIG